MFRIVTVHSVETDLTARAVIRNRALALFSERGPDAVTVRDIAAAAEVSPALVLHHYGSKAGLRAEVDAHVAGIFDQALEAMAGHPEILAGEGRAAAASIAELLLTGLPAGSPVPAYLRRLLLSGDPTGRAVFARWYAATAEVTARLTDAGVMRPSDDPAVRAAFLLANDLAVVLLRDQLADVLGVDPLSPEGMTRWATDLLAAYAHGVYATEEP